ncbi:hypothetical protein KAR91_12645 [Candidatus Pacearchaeota archaeon]|nr:hypothetical protein [Candidatus Pacearchaeota archaeon]
MSEKNEFAITVLSSKLENANKDLLETERELQRFKERVERATARILTGTEKRDSLILSIKELTSPTVEEIIIEETNE